MKRLRRAINRMDRFFSGLDRIFDCASDTYRNGRCDWWPTDGRP